MLLYAVLHLVGVEDVPIEVLKRFRQWRARTAGHPEYGHAKGVDVTNGPLGQGLAGAVGMAMAERMLRAAFGSDLVDHRTWVFCDDGCLMQEISLAGHHRLSKLCLPYDDNGISIGGSTAKAITEDVSGRSEAAGWRALSCDGHDVAALDEAIINAKSWDRPMLIRMRTVIGPDPPSRRGATMATARCSAPRSGRSRGRRSPGSRGLPPS